jgi:DNA-binding transcriptional MerR regulator
MSDIGEEPFFNLKAVIRQTGLKPDTLRAWERRYGMPLPERSPGGHRLYSQHDISAIKWLMARQQEGMSIKRAVELWRQIEREGRDPLRSATPLAAEGAPPLALRAKDGTVAELRESWRAACLAYDERTAEQILAQAFALYAPETVGLKLLQKAMAQIGTGWYEGNVTVQQEHFCSALAIRRVEALIMAAPPPTRPGRILAACPAEEHHTFGLLLMVWLLRRRGWEVIYLGADVPAERLEITVAATHPQLMILAAQQLRSAATLLDTARILKEKQVPLAYGGLIFNLLPALHERIPGHFLGGRLESAPQTAESLLSAPRAVPVVKAVPDSYHQARQHFIERVGLIEAQLDEAWHGMGIMNYLGADIDWLVGLLKNHGIPGEALHNYLATYYEAASQQLGEQGRPIVAWLGRLSSRSDIS